MERTPGLPDRPRPRIASWVAPCLVGLSSFLAVIGPRVLQPTNLDWLHDRGDSMTHYLGWAFFRHGPWTVPLGANPDYGLEIASSVLYSDSIPLLALLFKPWSALLPEPFQYTGLWLLACFVLQALLAWLLAGLATPRPWIRIAASVLFVFSPPMLFRLSEHWALVGHWTILAALVLVFRPGRRRQALSWAVLATVAALVHTYLMVMVAALWLSAWAGDVLRATRSRRALVAEALVVPAAMLVALWQAGFFLVGEGKSQHGYGDYRMNLNSPVNAAGWSWVLPTLDQRPHDYEGMAFLGLGGLVAVALAVPATISLWRRGRVRLRREWVPLALVLVVLTVFAASNEVGFGLHGFACPLPEALLGVTGMLRASGRLFWPVFYVLLLGAVAAIVRAWPARASLALLAGVAAVQVLDTSAGWRAVRPRLHARAADGSVLASPFWGEAAGVYDRVRLIPPSSHAENWSVVADVAQRHRMATDAVYLARFDPGRARALWIRTMRGFAEGRFDADTFYVVQGDRSHLAPCVIDPDRDLVARVDGFWVLLPGWRLRFGDGLATEGRPSCPVLTPDGAPIAFSTGSEGTRALTSGWLPPDPWGAWNDGRWSVLNLHVDGRSSAIELSAAPPDRAGPPIEVEVSVDGGRVTSWRMAPGREARWYRVALPDRGATTRRRVRLNLTFSGVTAAASPSGSRDGRALAFALFQARAVE